MRVSHHTSNESTSRLYGSLVAPPETLTLPTVNSSRCQTMKTSSVSPPQRMKREEKEDAAFFFTWYFTVRALPVLRHSVTAAYRSEEHTSELQSPDHIVCRLLLEKT